MSTPITREIHRLPARQVGAALVLLFTAVACGSTSASSANPSEVSLRVGYLANLTHAPAIVGLDKGLWATALGSHVKLTTQSFNAGPDEMTSLIGGGLDAAFVGPGPATNTFAVSSGDALRIVAGATSGGAGLVLRQGVTFNSATDLKGRTLATPQLGNTQDVALRAYLLAHGLKTDPQGGGDVKVAPAANATALQEFKQSQIDGAWEPEPWVTRMVVEGGGTEVLDERSLWPGAQFATTILVVARAFLDQHPDVIRSLITAHLQALDWMANDPQAAQNLVSSSLKQLTNTTLAPAVLTTSWSHLTFTDDPIADSVKKSASDAVKVGVATGGSLNGIFDLRILNSILQSENKSLVSAGGLGKQ